MALLLRRQKQQKQKQKQKQKQQQKQELRRSSSDGGNAFVVVVVVVVFISLLIAPVAASGAAEGIRAASSGEPPDLVCSGAAKTSSSSSSSKTAISYADLHACVFGHRYALSVPCLLGFVALSFYVLASTAQAHFTPVVSRMSELLDLSPSTGGVTLLALGNGAPDAFTSVAAVWAENSRLGLGAIISAGLFVSAFVVGFVALASSPSNFRLNPFNFLRDICFYIVAVALMFWTYLRGEVHAWQAIALVSIYVLFVAAVFAMDRSGKRRGGGRRNAALKLSRSCLLLDRFEIDRNAGEEGEEEEEEKCGPMSRREGENGDRNGIDLDTDGRGRFGHVRGIDLGHGGEVDMESGEDLKAVERDGAAPAEGHHQDKEAKDPSRVLRTLACSLFYCGGQCKDSSSSNCDQTFKVQWLWQLPVEVVLRSTIPAVNPSQWNRAYASANLVLCPLILLYIVRSAISPYKKMVFVVPGVDFPLWSLVLLQGTILAAAYFILTKEPPKEELPIAVVSAFVMSVFWISFVAGELVGCLEALGVLLKLPPALLGLTVLAWGNSIGDLVADVAVARAGQPAMAMAGCFAGPMFNMLVGFGLALAVKTSRIYPKPYILEYNPSIVVAFFFLFASLVGSLVVVTCNKFRVPRLWGFWLIGLYIAFVLVSISNSS